MKVPFTSRRSTSAGTLRLRPLLLFLVLALNPAGCGPGGGSPPPLPAPSAVLSPEGGEVRIGRTVVSVAAETLIRPIEIEVRELALPTDVPPELVPIGAAFDFEVDDLGALNAPIEITLPYEDAGLDDERNLFVVHQGADGRYEPTTILRHDVNLNTITFDTRNFSPFFIVEFLVDLLPQAFAVPTSSFSPSEDSWNIPNFASFLSPGGNCLGMSAYSAWFPSHRPTESLKGGKFPSVGGVASAANLVATRAHLAQSQYWATTSSRMQQAIGDPAWIGLHMKAQLLLGQPLILIMFGRFPPDAKPSGHACVLYAYDESGFTFYDVNYPDDGLAQRLSFDGEKFGTYQTWFDTFGWVAMPSLGRTEDFEALTREAEQGFPESAHLSVDDAEFRDGDLVVLGSTAEVRGRLTGDLAPPRSGLAVIAYIKGQKTPITPQSDGSFIVNLPVDRGEGTVVLLAGVNLALQSNWMTNAACVVFSTVRPPDLEGDRFKLLRQFEGGQWFEGEAHGRLSSSLSLSRTGSETEYSVTYFDGPSGPEAEGNRNGPTDSTWRFVRSPVPTSGPAPAGTVGQYHWRFGIIRIPPPGPITADACYVSETGRLLRIDYALGEWSQVFSR